MKIVPRLKNYISGLAMERYWGKIEKKTGTKFIEIKRSEDEHNNNYELTPVHHLRFCEKFLRSTIISKCDAAIDVGCGRGVFCCF